MRSAETIVNQFVELSSDYELEILNEIQDNYREVQRLHDVKKKEFLRASFESKIRKDLGKI